MILHNLKLRRKPDHIQSHTPTFLHCYTRVCMFILFTNLTELQLLNLGVIFGMGCTPGSILLKHDLDPQWGSGIVLPISRYCQMGQIPGKGVCSPRHYLFSYTLHSSYYNSELKACSKAVYTSWSRKLLDTDKPQPTVPLQLQTEIQTQALSSRR